METRLAPIITDWLLSKFKHRLSAIPCDVAIGGLEDPYLERWHIIPRNRLFNIYLHRILRSDDDRALHDHPWWSVSLCLDGSMEEHLPDRKIRKIVRGSVIFRGAKAAHRLELTSWWCVTLFITGPKIREWGFHCPANSPAGGWRHWREYTQTSDSTKIGRGCGE